MRITTQIKGGTDFSHRLRELQEKISRRASVYVGLPAGSGEYEDGVQLVTIGAVQEFGSNDGKIPERSFLRVPLRSSQKFVAKIFRNLMPKVLDGEITMHQMLTSVGAKGAAISQEAISKGIAPENAPSTVSKKGSSTPLIDTGRLRQAITYLVEGDK